MKGLYFRIFISIIMILGGNKFIIVQEYDYWIERILYVVVFTVGVGVLINFQLKNIPKNSHQNINLKIIGIGFFGTLSLYVFAQSFGTFTSDLFDLEIQSKGTIELHFVLTLILWSFLEELYARKIIAEAVSNKYNFTIGIFISSLVFSLIHFFSNSGLFYPFLIGILFSMFYLRTHSFVFVIILHLSYNLLVLFNSDYLIINLLQMKNTTILLIAVASIFLFFTSLFLLYKATYMKTSSP